MNGIRIRFAIVLIGTGLGLAYLLSAAFLLLGMLWLERQFGLAAAILMLFPAFVGSVATAVVVSMPFEFVGALLVALGIRNQGASPYLEGG